MKTDATKSDAIEKYRRAYRDFRWETPEHFNFAAAPAEPDRRA